MTAVLPPARPPRIPKTPPPEVVASPRIQALEGELAAAGSGAERGAISEAFWAAVAAEGTPLVESPWADAPGDRAVTFLWRDAYATADGTRTVVLLANKVTDPSVWDESVLHRIAGTDIWHRTYRLAADWQGTYQLAPDDGPAPAADATGPQHGPRSRWAGVATTARPDPLCRRRLAGKPGELPSSVGVLDQATPQPWRDARPGVPRGRLTQSKVRGHQLAEARRVWVYAPAASLAPAGTRHNLLVLLDGEDWAGRLDLVSTLDNLIAERRIPPTIAVMVDAIDTQARWRELTCDPAFTGFLTGELLLWARATLPVHPDAAHTTISGRSLGGLTALYAGLRAPHQFGAVHAQSASLWWPAEPVGDREPGWLVDELAAAEQLPARVALEVGLQEWMLLEPGRALAGVLGARGDVATTLTEYQGGHDAWCWRGGLADTLAQLAARPPSS
jgi:enterochelin esterase-like enzyme